MSVPDSYSYLRYLQAKEPVDERARNERVWDDFLAHLTSRVGSPLRILEVGAGAGATAARILQALRDRTEVPVEYTLVDVVPEHLAAARNRLRNWATDHGHDFVEEGETARIAGSPAVSVRFIAADLFDVATTENLRVDAIVAQAVLDILPLDRALSSLRGLLRPEGLWYLPIHFDGVTAFEPPLSTDLDGQIEQLYHRSMSGEGGKEGGPAGAQTGRRLLTCFQETGATLLAAGSSDWVVFARDGAYAGDVSYFLHHVVHFVEEELTGHPELSADAFERWIGERRRQIERGELTYVAHQLDVLAKEGGG